MSDVQVLVTATLIGIGSNLDNTGVGLAYGTADRRVPHRVNALINAIGLVAALVGGYAGRAVAPYLSADTADRLSCGVLVAVGLGCWYVAYVRPHLGGHREEQPKQPGWRMGVALGLSLGVNNVANGFGATVSDSRLLWPTVVSITVCGYLAIWIGDVVGIDLVAHWLSRYSSFVAGLLLIGVGIHELFA